MTLPERIRRLSVWLAYQLTPKSPAFDRDEQMAAMRGVRRTPRKSARAVGAAGRATQQERESRGHYSV